MLEKDSLPSLKHLSALHEVVASGSLARAARQLHRSPSAVSRSVKLLEDRFGCPLFLRSREAHEPTAAGKLIVARIEGMRRDLRSLLERLKRADIGAAGHEIGSFARLEFDASRLRALVAVHDLGSLQGAGRLLGVSQPALSFSIRQLEADLGIGLFARTPNGMTPTTAGSVTCQFAKRILNELRKMTEDIASLGGEPSGLVCIGGLAYSRSRLLPEAITQTLERHPRIIVRTVEGPLDSLLVAVKTGEIDAIICAAPDPSRLDGITVEPLVDDRLGLFVNAGHPLAKRKRLTARTLVEFPFILPPLGSITRSLLEGIFKTELDRVPGGSVETSSAFVIRKLLLRSNHISFRSLLEFEEDVANDRIVALDLDFTIPSRRICILQRAGSDQTPAVRSFLDLVRDVARDNAATVAEARATLRDGSSGRPPR